MANKNSPMTAAQMSANISYILFRRKLNAYETNFLFYIAYFVETTFKILNKKKFTRRKFWEWVNNKGETKQQQLANEICKMLKNRKTWVEQKSNFIKLESLLLRYEFSRNEWKEKIEKSKRLNTVRHKEDKALTDYILDLHKKWLASQISLKESPKPSVKRFYHRNEEKIAEFIENNCPNLHEKIETDADYDLFDRIRKIIYKRNQRDNKNILSLQLEEHSN